MAQSGIILLDKPAGWTSHDVVAKLRGVLGTRRVGHAGTLDPMATGLLILGVEQGTRFLNFVVGLDKTYTATIRLGQSTNTDDSEGEVTAAAPIGALDAVDTAGIDAQIAALSGDLMQVPSSVSAIKVDGKRAYALVRGGEEVKLKPRPVRVHHFERLADPARSANFIDVSVEVSCSSGTYIRALARDLGLALGVGGHLVALRRTLVGPYQVGSASGILEPDVISLKTAARQLFESVELSESQETDIRHGKRISLPDLGASDSLAAWRGTELVAMLTKAGPEFKSLAVFASSSPSLPN